MKTILTLLIILALTFSILFAETIEDKLSDFGETNGKMYIKPFVTSFGSNLNSGLFATAKVMKPSVIKPVRIGFAINTMIAFVPDSDLTFMAKRPEIKDPMLGTYIYNESEIETATVFGNKSGKFTSNNPEVEDFKMSKGADISLIPLMVPQIDIGLPFGNEILIRYFPKVEMSKDIGDIEFFGIGLKHSVDQYLTSLFPFSIALQGVYQNFKLGDMIEIQSIALNAQVSKTLLMWTVYGGLQYEATTLDAKYTTSQPIINTNTGAIENKDIDIKFSVEGDNDVRAIAGLRFRFLIFNLNTDYSIGAQNVFNIGFGASF